MAIDPREFQGGFAAPTVKTQSKALATDRENAGTLDILAWTMLGEAANQGEEGLAAIAHVIKNRAESGDYPSDLKRVALQPKQFSTWNSGQGGNNPKSRFSKDSAAFKEARRIAAEVLNGAIPDPTGGATHYWSPKGMKAMGYNETPYWADEEAGPFGQVAIKDHVFLPKRPVPSLGLSDEVTPRTPSPLTNWRRQFRPATQSAELLASRTPAPLPVPKPLTFPPLKPKPINNLVGGGAPGVDSPQLFSNSVGQPEYQIPLNDATYSGANKMSVGGLGALLGRSVSMTAPNPIPRVQSYVRPEMPGRMPAAPARAPLAGVPDSVRYGPSAQMVTGPTGAQVRGDQMAAIRAVPSAPARTSIPFPDHLAGVPDSIRFGPTTNTPRPTGAPIPLPKSAAMQVRTAPQIPALPTGINPLSVIPKTAAEQAWDDIGFGKVRDDGIGFPASYDQMRTAMAPTVMVPNPAYKIYLGQLAANQRMTPTGSVIGADMFRALNDPNYKPPTAPKLVAPPQFIPIPAPLPVNRRPVVAPVPQQQTQQLAMQRAATQPQFIYSDGSRSSSGVGAMSLTS